MDWKKVKTLGAGTFGTVSLWKCASTGEFVAVKIFRIPAQHYRALSFADKYKILCKTEVERMEGIHHPNIVAAMVPPKELSDEAKKSQKSSQSGSSDNDSDPVFESPQHDLPFLCMEYCSKGDLRQLLKRPQNLNGLQEDEILSILSDISNAILYLHNEKRILHRDIKPENIVIQWDPALKRAVYKLSDFGLAKDVSSLETLCSTQVGTAEYLAPEIRIGVRYNRTVDFWSFGLVAYEISCGRLPFTKENLPSFNNRLPRSFKQIPMRTHLAELYRKNLSNWLPSMLQFDPGKRGCLKILKDHKEVATCSLAWLRNLLETTFLHIHSHIAGQLVFRVLPNTTLGEVQFWIQDLTNLPVEDQMLLTADGTELTSQEMARDYSNDSNSLLFLIQKTGQRIYTRIELPKSLNSLLIESDDSFDANSDRLKELWSDDIFHVQTQLRRTEEFLKAEEALRKKHIRSGSPTVAQEDVERMKDLQIRFRELRASFHTIVTMDKMLEEVDGKFPGDNLRSIDLSSAEIKTAVEDLHSYTENYFHEYFQYCNANLRLHEGLNSTILTELYENLLREYDDWKTLAMKGTYDLKKLEEVRKIISIFLTVQKTILISVDNNIKLLTERTIPQKEKQEKVLKIFEKLERFQRHLMKQRQMKQQMILELALSLQSMNPTCQAQLSPPSSSIRNQNGHASPKFPTKLITSVKSVFEGRKQKQGPILVSEMTRTNFPSCVESDVNPEGSDNFWVVVDKE
ncbi:unnamed protein product [Allacma fusca]|uniref:IkappaB kinase n=1 Tax=Allacma fusca TaxID=39272 RepID=A0A8J2P2W4_9HEXA|nr:unnamed protein product [Allacma fusca]